MSGFKTEFACKVHLVGRNSDKAVTLGALLVILRDRLAEYGEREERFSSITDETANLIRLLLKIFEEAVEELEPWALKLASVVPIIASPQTAFLADQLGGILREEDDTILLLLRNARYFERVLILLVKERAAPKGDIETLLDFLSRATNAAIGVDIPPTAPPAATQQLSLSL